MPIRQMFKNANAQRPRRIAIGLLAGGMVAVSLFSTSVGWAQTKPTAPAAPAAAKPAQPAVANVPERTTATFGDWILRCETVGEPATRRCEVAQIIAAKGQQGAIAQVAIGRLAARGPLRLTMILPVNVSIPARPKIQTAPDDTAPLELSWTECLGGGCLATATLTDEAVARLAVRSEPGSIAFKDAAQRDVGIGLSFRGLAQAMAALGKD